MLYIWAEDILAPGANLMSNAKLGPTKTEDSLTKALCEEYPCISSGLCVPEIIYSSTYIWSKAYMQVHISGYYVFKFTYMLQYNT